VQPVAPAFERHSNMKPPYFEMSFVSSHRSFLTSSFNPDYKKTRGSSFALLISADPETFFLLYVPVVFSEILFMVVFMT